MADYYCPRCHALLTEVDEAARECTQCGEPIVPSAKKLRLMPDALFVEEWTKPAAAQRFSFNDLLAEAKRRGYDAQGRQVRPVASR